MGHLYHGYVTNNQRVILFLMCFNYPELKQRDQSVTAPANGATVTALVAFSITFCADLASFLCQCENAVIESTFKK